MISKINKIIWVIDEFHSLKGKGTHEYQSNDISEMMKPGLANGELHVIGMSTEDEFYGAYAGDTPLLERFAIANKEEPRGEELQ